MQQYGKVKLTPVSWKLGAALLAAFMMLIVYSGVVFAQAVIVQTYFVPVDEDDALASLRAINTASVAQVQSYVSVAVGTAGTHIYYDHWEDGFLPNFTAAGILGSGGTTEIWGDGICSNGYPPNKGGVAAPGTCTAAWDTFAGGDVVVLQSAIGISGNTTITEAERRDTIDFDGGDMIASTEQIAVSRVYWAAGSNTLSAAAIELYPSNEWGEFYRSPVGQDTTGANSQFTYTSVSIQASANGTVVSVDHDNNSGTAAVTCNLNQGESCVVNNILQGATITSNADHPVQVHGLTGAVGSNYSYSGYTLLPVSAYSNDYYAPVSQAATYTVRVFLFNPSGTPLEVRCEFDTGGTNVTVPANGTAYADVPNTTTGERCFTRVGGGGADQDDYDPNGEHFFATVTHDLGTTYDWGVTMMPAAKLDKQVLVGIGLGQDPTQPTTENGSPIWVTPIADACLFVDANGDGWMDALALQAGGQPRYDVTNSPSGTHAAGLPRGILTSTRFFHSDGDQTGMRIFSREPVGGVCPTFDNSLPGPDIVAVWGQDPGRASVAIPGFDVGVTVPNLRGFSFVKLHELAPGRVNVRPGDTITYTVRLRNTSFGGIVNVVIKDTQPAEIDTTASVVTLTRFNPAGVPVATYTLTASEKNDFFGAGFALNVAALLGGTTLERDAYIDAVFTATVRGTPGDVACASFFVNKVTVTVEGKPLDSSTSTPCGPPAASVGDRVWRDLNPIGSTATEQRLGDGLQNSAIEPNVAGIEVQLWTPGPNGTVDGALLMTTTTDANGEYLFDNLDPGDYYIVFVNRSGYPAVFSTMVKQGADPAVDSDGAPSMGTGVNAGVPVATTDIFTLVAGQHDPTWDQALVSTSGIGSAELGDRIWWDTNKNGVQDTGELGVEGVTVELFRVDTADAPIGSGVLVDDTLTDANGNYLFTGLDGGFYYVKFTLPSGVAVTVRAVGGDRGTDSNIDELGFSEVVNLREAESNLTIDAGIFVVPTSDPDDPDGEPNVGDFTNMLWLPAVTNR